MVRRGVARKVKGPNSPCWFCQKPTQIVLIDLFGDEVWACEACCWKHGKIKRFKGSATKSLASNKKSQNSGSLHVKKMKSGYQGVEDERH